MRRASTNYVDTQADIRFFLAMSVLFYAVHLYPFVWYVSSNNINYSIIWTILFSFGLPLIQWWLIEKQRINKAFFLFLVTTAFSYGVMALSSEGIRHVWQEIDYFGKIITLVGITAFMLERCVLLVLYLDIQAK